MLEWSRSAKDCNAVPMLSPAALQVYARPHLADKALAERILEAAGDASCCDRRSRARCCLHSQTTACHASRCRTLSLRLPSQLVDKSVRCFADDPRAFDAFLSILFAPQASAGSFDDMLRSIQRHGLPMLLVYGREDPWVRTIWGQRIVRIVPQATFYQVVDPASRHVRTSVTHATEFSTDLLRLFRPLSVRRFCEPVLVYHLHMSGPVSPSGETQIMLPMPLCRLDTHALCTAGVASGTLSTGRGS